MVHRRSKVLGDIQKLRQPEAAIQINVSIGQRDVSHAGNIEIGSQRVGNADLIDGSVQPGIFVVEPAFADFHLLDESSRQQVIGRQGCRGNDHIVDVDGHLAVIERDCDVVVVACDNRPRCRYRILPAGGSIHPEIQGSRVQTSQKHRVLVGDSVLADQEKLVTGGVGHLKIPFYGVEALINIGGGSDAASHRAAARPAHHLQLAAKTAQAGGLPNVRAIQCARVSATGRVPHAGARVAERLIAVKEVDGIRVGQVSATQAGMAH